MNSGMPACMAFRTRIVTDTVTVTMRQANTTHIMKLNSISCGSNTIHNALKRRPLICKSALRPFHECSKGAGGLDGGLLACLLSRVETMQMILRSMPCHPSSPVRHDKTVSIEKKSQLSPHPAYLPPDSASAPASPKKRPRNHCHCHSLAIKHRMTYS